MIDPVTSRYGEALFRLARAKGALDDVRNDLERLARELATAANRSVFDARIPRETRRERVRGLARSMHPLTQNLIELLFDKRREEVLRELARAFHRRLLEERGAAEGIVESARALGRAEVERLESSLGPRLKKKLTLENKIVPELVGGVRVVVESRMLDFSLAGRLEDLRKRLLVAPLPRQ